MKKTILGLVLAGAASYFPIFSPAALAQEEEEEPDHQLVCEQQFLSLEDAGVNRFSSSMPSEKLQRESKEILWGIIQQHYAGNPLEEMLDSWRTIKIQEIQDWPDVEKEVTTVLSHLRAAYQDECLVKELKKWRSREWVEVKKEVYKISIAELCADQEVYEECERGLEEKLIAKDDYDKTPPEVCPMKGGKEDECYVLFNSAIKRELLRMKKIIPPSIDEVRKVLNPEGKRRPYILTPQVNEQAEIREGVVWWEQYFTGEDKLSTGQTELSCSGDGISSITIIDHLEKEKSKFRVAVKVRDLGWRSNSLNYYTLVCVAHEENRLSLPYNVTFQVDGLGKKNPREKFHSRQSLEGLFSPAAPAAQGRLRSENKMMLYSKEPVRPFLAAHGFIQIGKETANGSGRAGELFSGMGIAEMERFRTFPFSLSLLFGYNSRIGDVSSEITLEGQELFKRDFQYQLRYKRGLLASAHRQILEGSLEVFMKKVKPWGTEHKMDFGIFARASGDRTSLHDFSLGPKIRLPHLSRYSTYVDLRLGYSQERWGNDTIHSVLSVISLEL